MLFMKCEYSQAFQKPPWVIVLEPQDAEHPGLRNLPWPNVEITESQAHHHMSSQLPDWVSYAQVLLVGEKVMREVTIYWQPGVAVAICPSSNWTLVDGEYTKIEPTRYFRIGCEHELEITRQQGSTKWAKCKVCGFETGWDSGD